MEVNERFKMRTGQIVELKLSDNTLCPVIEFTINGEVLVYTGFCGYFGAGTDSVIKAVKK